MMQSGQDGNSCNSTRSLDRSMQGRILLFRRPTAPEPNANINLPTTIDPEMSAKGQKQTCAAQNVMSALPPKADMCGALTDVRLVPIADIKEKPHAAE